MIRPMNMYRRPGSRFWTALLLLFALFAAQQLVAEHIHLDKKPTEFCNLCFNHMPAAAERAFQLPQPAPLVTYREQSAPVPRDCQPERQSARGPPAPLQYTA
ncbi:hypothetical protein [Microbulbifer sp. SAOS-129_SWC]|uniref:hypothetical protein n=1 Tax=Microbulbifer sp. SAOS-129_SWC TaxID=3145235 RepID=UPI003216528F